MTLELLQFIELIARMSLDRESTVICHEDSTEALDSLISRARELKAQYESTKTQGIDLSFEPLAGLEGQ